ncbi:methylamine utilization protein [Marinobacteraceae bacterium S3BR75-40.1]
MTGMRCITGLLLLALATSVQSREVRLQVLDANGQPLQNAVVTVSWPGADPAPPLPEPALMIQRDRTFIPHVLAIPRGSEVDFPNRDTTRHHVYSFSKAKTFDIKLYADRPEQPIHFDRTGIVVLGCNIHDHMKAYIVVTQAPRRAVSDTEGHITLNIPDEATQGRIWHPWAGSSESAWQTFELPRDPGPKRVPLDVTAPKPRKTPLMDLQQRFNNLSS